MGRWVLKDDTVPHLIEAAGGFLRMKLKHYDNDGHARFVTFCIHHSLPILTNDPFRRIVVDAIDKSRAAHGFEMLAYVIMPEHVHLVLWPPEIMKLGTVVGEIKRYAAKEILNNLSRADGLLLERLTVTRDSVERRVLWQRRCYDHNCRTEKAVWEKVNYCHQNPVKRGLVQSAEDWEWSSYRWYDAYREVPLQMDMAAGKDKPTSREALLVGYRRKIRQ